MAQCLWAGSEGSEVNSDAILMLLQTNSYIVPKEKRAEHARLMRRFRQVLNRLGCDHFEVYEQVGANWSPGQAGGRFVQMMRFRDRKHQLAVQNAERTDQAAQELIAEFCELVNYPYQQQQGQFAVGFYNSVLPVAPIRPHRLGSEQGAGGVEQTADASPEVAGGAIAGSAAAQGLLNGGADTAGGDEAGQEVAADEFAREAEAHPAFGEPGASGQDAADAEPLEPVLGEEDEAVLGEEDVTVEGDTDAESAYPAPAEDAGGAPAAPAEQPPVGAEADAAAAEQPAPNPDAASGEFSLDDLAGDEGDVVMTDDDLARLADELAAEPPRGDGGPGGRGGHGGNR